jgi:hypothetical protein
MAAGAFAPFDVIKELALKFRGDFLSVDGGLQIRSLEPFRELGGLFVVGSAGEMRFVWVAWRRERAFVSNLVLIALFLDLIVFRRFSFGDI